MEKTPSKSSPKGGKRGCLCANGKYSVKCCDGSLEAQGIGNVTKVGTESNTVTNTNTTRTITHVS